MEDFILTCCSTTDMYADYFHKRDIPYAYFHYMIDGKTYDDDYGKSMPVDRFYQLIKEGAAPTTSQVNAEEFMHLWKPYLEKGKAILHLTLSSGISGVYNSAKIAEQMANEEYPNAKVIVIDSLCASSGYGMLVDYVADLRDTGVSIDQAAEWVETNKLNIHHWFFSTDLSSYVRGGRISKPEARLGSLLKVCPLLNMDDEGRLIPREKVRTKRRVIQAMFEKMQAFAQDGAEYDGKCFLSNSACLEDAQAVVDLIEAYFPKLKGKVLINNIGTVIGSHTGPGTVALFFMGNKRTK